MDKYNGKNNHFKNAHGFNLDVSVANTIWKIHPVKPKEEDKNDEEFEKDESEASEGKVFEESEEGMKASRMGFFSLRMAMRKTAKRMIPLQKMQKLTRNT